MTASRLVMFVYPALQIAADLPPELLIGDDLVQNNQKSEEHESSEREDVEAQYRQLKLLRKQLIFEQSELLRHMPVSTRH